MCLDVQRAGIKFAIDNAEDQKFLKLRSMRMCRFEFFDVIDFLNYLIKVNHLDIKVLKNLVKLLKSVA